MVSPVTLDTRERRQAASTFKTTKLAPNMYPKTRYVTHLRNLQFYMANGAIVTKFHRIISFHQEAWIAPYIIENTRLRQQSIDDFEKSYYKMLNNAFFGKTMENVRKRIRIALIDNVHSHQFYTSKPGYKRFSIFSENLVGVEFVQPTVTLDKPIYVGFTVLELSKELMFKFHYNIFKQKFPNSKLLFTVTDSLCFHVMCNNVYERMREMTEHFDFSNFSQSSPYFDGSNRAVLGKFKDECGGVAVREFVGLRSKCYSLLTENCEQKQACAGVKTNIAKKYLKHELYKNMLLHQQNDFYISQNTFRSYNHCIKTIKSYKVGLTTLDHKRWICSDFISTRPLGHYLNKVE